MASRVRIVAAALVAGFTTLLPWFRETGPGTRRVTLNAWQADGRWPALAMVILVLFAGAALYALARDLRWLNGAVVAGLLTFVVFMTQCWLNHRPTMANAAVARRWGLFVALNAALLLGAVVKSVGDRAALAVADADDLPLATGYEIG
jgi:hypothetical protein